MVRMPRMFRVLTRFNYCYCWCWSSRSVKSVLRCVDFVMSQLMRMEARKDKFPGRQMSEEGVWRERVAAAEKCRFQVAGEQGRIGEI